MEPDYTARYNAIRELYALGKLAQCRKKLALLLGDLEAALNTAKADATRTRLKAERELSGGDFYDSYDDRLQSRAWHAGQHQLYLENMVRLVTDAMRRIG